MKDCDLLKDNGRCAKSYNRMLCKNCRSDPSWFDDAFDVCDVDEVCRKSSVFGNKFFAITEEDIKLLKQGKVLYYVDEYGAFIMLKGEE